MPAKIRPRRDDDLPDLADVLVRVHELDGYPVEGVADPEAWLRHPRALRSWTAVEGTRPVGQVVLTRALAGDDTARAWHEHTGGDIGRLAVPARLFVDPAHRASGVGRSLMEAAIGFARASGLAVALDVMLKDRAAIRLYERLDAERVADLTHRYGDGLTEPAAVYVVRPGETWGRG